MFPTFFKQKKVIHDGPSSIGPGESEIHAFLLGFIHEEKTALATMGVQNCMVSSQKHHCQGLFQNVQGESLTKLVTTITEGLPLVKFFFYGGRSFREPGIFSKLAGRREVR